MSNGDPASLASNGISLLDEARQFAAEGHKGHSLVKQLFAAIDEMTAEIARLKGDATRFCAEATTAENEVTRLTVERDQLLTAIGEHVTVRSDQYALIQRLTRERDIAREALRISEQRVREHWSERDRLRHERNAAHRKADRLLTALKSIRDLRCSAFRTYQQNTEDMRAIASRALALPSEPSPAPETPAQPVVYQTCAKHSGMTFEMMVSATPYQFQMVCPICEPPTWHCRCGATNTTARCSNCDLTVAESDEIERRQHMIFPIAPSVCMHEKARITCDDCGIDLRGATLEQPSNGSAD